MFNMHRTLLGTHNTRSFKSHRRYDRASEYSPETPQAEQDDLAKLSTLSKLLIDEFKVTVPEGVTLEDTLSQKLADLFQIAVKATNEKQRASALNEVTFFIKKLASYLVPNKQKIIQNSFILTEAAKNDFYEIIDLLIEHGAYASIYRNNEKYPDYAHCYAIKHGSVKSLNALRMAYRRTSKGQELLRQTSSVEGLNSLELLLEAIAETPNQASKQMEMLDYLIQEREHIDTSEGYLLALTVLKYKNPYTAQKFINHDTIYPKNFLMALVRQIQPEDKNNILQIIEMLLLKYNNIPIQKESAAALELATKNYAQSFPELILILKKYLGKTSQVNLNINSIEPNAIPAEDKSLLLNSTSAKLSIHKVLKFSPSDNEDFLRSEDSKNSDTYNNNENSFAAVNKNSSNRGSFSYSEYSQNNEDFNNNEESSEFNTSFAIPQLKETLSKHLNSLFKLIIEAKNDEKQQKIALNNLIQVIKNLDTYLTQLPGLAMINITPTDKEEIIQNSGILKKAIKSNFRELIELLIIQRPEEHLSELVKIITPENKERILETLGKTLLNAKSKFKKDTLNKALLTAIFNNHYELYPGVIRLLEMFTAKISQEILNENLEISIFTRNPIKVKGLINADGKINDPNMLIYHFIDSLRLINPVDTEESVLNILKILLTTYEPSINKEKLKETLIYAIGLEKETHIYALGSKEETYIHDIGLNRPERYPRIISLLKSFTGEISQTELNAMLHYTVKDRHGYPDGFLLKYRETNEAYEEEIKVKGLIKAGADINSLDFNNMSPLHIAIKNCKYHIAIILCAAKPSLEILNSAKDNCNEQGYYLNRILDYTAFCHLGKRDPSPKLYRVIEALVNAGSYVSKKAIESFSNDLRHHSYPEETLFKINYILQDARNKQRERQNLEAQEERRKQYEELEFKQKIELYLKTRNKPVQAPESGVELNSLNLYSSPEEKNIPKLEDIYHQFRIKSPIMTEIYSQYKDVSELIRLSFLNQEPSQKLLTRIKTNQEKYTAAYNNFLYCRLFHNVFKDMIQFIKNYDEKDSPVTRAILNLIKHLQSANQQGIFAHKDEYLEKEVPLFYCSEYPEIQNALLKFAPFEQCRLVEESKIININLPKNDKLAPNADLYDLLFYLLQRDDNPRTYLPRVQVLLHIIGHLRDKNWQEAFKLVKDRSKELSTPLLTFFGKSQNVADILKGISNRFKTIEAFEEHAQGFLHHIDQVKYKILIDQGLVTENNALSSNNNTNSKGPN